MDAPKSLLIVIRNIKSELNEFCSADGSKKLISLVEKKGCGFSVKSQDKTYLGIAYKDAFIAFNRGGKPEISLSTSGNNETSESKRFEQDENLFNRLLSDLRKLKS